MIRRLRRAENLETRGYNTGEVILMTYRGLVKDGKVVLEPGVQLPDGTPVTIEPVCPASDPADGLADEAVATGILDLAAQHDDYAYGRPAPGK